ncbi:kinetochore protein NUF2 homolog isoform X2 [Silene latifolia]|uniref:kinetochore protein NUF2 homolog isoform X2 n=1 Tax=Silene latifolia TaxID=37657 RepID=UPI003D7718FE
MKHEASTTMAATYSLPSMSRPEIISFLTECQIITLSDSDLLNPTPNFVFNLYISLLTHINTLQDDTSQLDFEALERFDNPDMHIDSVRVMNLYCQIKDVLECTVCPTAFTLNDLIHPDSNRTAKFLTALINFSLHRDSKLSMLCSYGDQINLLEEERKQKESQILQLKEENEAIKAVKERERPVVLEVEAKVKELRQAIDNLNSLQSNLRKERQAIKGKAQELTNNVSTAEFELIQATEENAILRSKIVQSPVKLKRALEEKKAVAMEAKDSERLAMQRFQEKTATLEVHTKALQKITKQLAQMHTIQEQVNSAKSAEKDVKQLKAKLSDEQMLGKSLEAKVTECEAKAEKLDKEKRELEKEKNLSRDKDTRGLNDVKLEAESRRKDLVASRKKIEAIVAEADAVKSKIKSVKESEAATQVELLRKTEEIVYEVNVYSSSMAKVMLRVGDAGN